MCDTKLSNWCSTGNRFRSWIGVAVVRTHGHGIPIERVGLRSPWARMLKNAESVRSQGELISKLWGLSVLVTPAICIHWCLFFIFQDVSINRLSQDWGCSNPAACGKKCDPFKDPVFFTDGPTVIAVLQSYMIHRLVIDDVLNEGILPKTERVSSNSQFHRSSRRSFGMSWGRFHFCGVLHAMDSCFLPMAWQDLEAHCRDTQLRGIRKESQSQRSQRKLQILCLGHCVTVRFSGFPCVSILLCSFVCFC